MSDRCLTGSAACFCTALGYHSSARKVQLTHHAVIALHKERVSKVKEMKENRKKERKKDGGQKDKKSRN